MDPCRAGGLVLPRFYKGRWGAAGESCRVQEGYADLLKQWEIEAVYIALPNSVHVELTIRAGSIGRIILSVVKVAQCPISAARRLPDLSEL
jgi:hypothetical protein